MKRYFIIAVMLAAVTVAGAQGLRQSVCLVRPQYTETERNELMEYVIWLGRVKHTDEARYLRHNLLPDWFGSGVLVRRGEQLCVITSRHTVGYASKAKVVFYLHEGNVVYDNCPVLGTDGALLSLILLPDDCAQHPLPVANQLPEDGDDISVAGFPMLESKVTWQLSQGLVGNSWLEFNGLAFIQQSVVIDYGAAGGPMLVKKDDGYQVAGVNVSRLVGREGIGLAVPADSLSSMLSAPSLKQDAGSLL